MMRKTNPAVYSKKDSHMKRTLRIRDFLALGIGTIVSTAIFTLPGIVAAKHAGPAVSISFIIAAVIAGFSALDYAEMASAMPFAGSAFSWISVLFGEVWGWIAGWALLAEYFIAGAFISSGLSTNLQGLLSSIGFNLPKFMASSFGTKGGIFNLIAALAVLIVFSVLHHSTKGTAKIENVLVIAKIIVIALFIIVGITAVHAQNYVPFVPAHHINPDGSNFGGISGILAGVSMIFISYLGFDTLAANSAEAKDPKRTMPTAIIGSLVIASAMFIMVSLVLVGMFPYQKYAGNAQPVGWALRASHHVLTANVIEGVATICMFSALIGAMMAGSRLIYSFGRDGMLPKWLGHITKRGLPENALLLVTISSIVVGSVLPFTFITQLVSAGTLIAFMFVALAMFTLRHREGKDINEPDFKVPFYPVTPILAFIGTLIVFWNLDSAAKIYTVGWFVLGMIVYFCYGIRHEEHAKQAKK
ncbi:amino acid permease [uncultured bacterium]|nr:amino acid permease [uncultured bacterium]